MGAEVLTMEQNVVDETAGRKLIDATVERFGGLDILVNNAGIALMRPISEYSTADYDLQMDVNIRSVFFGCRKALPAMIASWWRLYCQYVFGCCAARYSRCVCLWYCQGRGTNLEPRALPWSMPLMVFAVTLCTQG